MQVRSRLTAGQVYEYLAGKNNYTQSSAKYREDGGKECSYYFENSNNKTIVTAPAHDSSDENIATSAAKIVDVLNNTKDQLQKNKSILVPICQLNNYSFFGLFNIPFFKRNHFTYLEINKDEAGKITAKHHDSKGWLSKLFYSLSSVKNAVKEVFGNDIQLQSNYYEHQSDDINCGRFMLTYIDDKINPKGPDVHSNPAKRPGVFDAIDNSIDEANKPQRTNVNQTQSKSSQTSDIALKNNSFVDIEIARRNSQSKNSSNLFK